MLAADDSGREDSAPVEVSVVMSVYNDASGLEKTINSVLEQQGPTFEFLIVDDGSSDDSPAIISNMAASDSRIRFLPQENTGLTAALARACKLARGELIARQDAVDISLPGRLAAQVAEFKAHPGCVLTAVGASFLTTDGLPIFDVVHDNPAAEQGLRLALAEATWEKSFSPPHHGGVMFRRSEYQAVGGYNTAFRVAQDFDLWLRLLERGHYRAIPTIFYEAVFDPASISGSRHDLQQQTKAIICAAARARAAGLSEDSLLQQAKALPTRKTGSPEGQAAGHYLLACRLMAQYPVRARKELQVALRLAPTNLKFWLRLLQTFLPQRE